MMKLYIVLTNVLISTVVACNLTAIQFPTAKLSPAIALKIVSKATKVISGISLGTIALGASCLGTAGMKLAFQIGLPVAFQSRRKGSFVFWGSLSCLCLGLSGFYTSYRLIHSACKRTKNQVSD